MNKFCLYCKKEFRKSYSVSKKTFLGTKFCSKRCHYSARRWGYHAKKYVSKKLTKNCEACNKKFEVYPYRKNMAHFCSRKCSGSVRWGKRGINWRGGITSINRVIRQSQDYKEWRTKVFKRDNYTCQDCGIVGGWLEVDHKKMFSRFPELRFEVSNGRTLCKPCHRIKTISDQKLNWRNQFMSAPHHRVY